ncbi:MAG: hypothetical protein ACR2OF_09470 [Hyphomicrobium sp.]
MKATCEFRVAFLAVAVLVTGCAQDGTFTTGSLNAAPDPACVTLASQIKKLEGQGVPEKVAKAAKKKYKMNSADLAKVAELNKANADFQAKCSNMPPNPNVAAAPANADKKTGATAKPKVAAKTPPPIPVHKPSTASLGAADAGAQAQGNYEAPQPFPQAGTSVIAPIAQDKSEAAQSPIETGSVSSAPPASGEPEAVQLTPKTEAPTIVPPAQ